MHSFIRAIIHVLASLLASNFAETVIIIAEPRPFQLAFHHYHQISAIISSSLTMCGNPYSRTPTIDSGDLIAVIHPSRVHINSFEGGKLRLSNRHPGATSSTLQCIVDATSSDESDNSDADIAQKFNVRIQ